MNRLECQVTNCSYNEERCCCLPDIHVDGPTAKSSNETCCASFEEKNSSLQNSANNHCQPSPNTSIDCKAQNCEYNEDCRCEADCVCVGCSCSEVQSKSATECCTFRCK